MNSSTLNSNSNGSDSPVQPAMKEKKFWKYLGGFFLLTFFLFFFDRGLYYIIFRAETNRYSQNEFEQQFEKYVSGKPFNTLIFGTSRSYEGINITYLERKTKKRAFKETFQGKGPKYNYSFYKVFKKYAGIPKVVVYGVDYFIYTVESDPKWMARFDSVGPKKSINFFSSPLLLLENKKKIDNFHNNILIELKEKKVVQDDSEIIKDIIAVQKYVGERNIIKKLDTLTGVSRRKRQFFPRPPGTEGEYFFKLLEELEKDQVTVILVALPDYIGSLKTNCQHDEFIRHLNSLSEKYKGVHVINFNSEEKFQLGNPEYFRDGGYGQTNSHLSPRGAEIFSNLLSEEIKKYYQ